MTYKTGAWGEQAKKISKIRTRNGYFRRYQKKRYKRRFNGFGSFGELIGLFIFKNSKIVRKPGYDLIWNNKKIEIKISKFIERYRGWYFNTHRQKDKCDLFLLVCTNKEKSKVERFYLIPNDIKVPTYIIKNPEHVDAENYEKFRIKRG